MYNDLPDDKFIEGFHNKFYSDMPIEDLQKKIGYDPALKGWDPHKEEQWDVGMGQILPAVGRAAKALPGSLIHAGIDPVEGLWDVLTHPVETGKKLYELGPGGIASAIGEDLSKKYGGADRIKKSLETDPAGMALDLITLGTGGSGLLRALGRGATKVARPVLAEAAGAATDLGAEPFHRMGQAGAAGPATAEGQEAMAGMRGRPSPTLAGQQAAGAQQAAPALAQRAQAAPWYDAGQAVQQGGWVPQHLRDPSLAGAGLGTLLGAKTGGAAAAAGIAASSPRLMGETMYGLGAAERGLGALPRARTGAAAVGAELTRDQLQEQAKATLKDKEAKAQLSNEDIKTVRKAAKGNADSRTMLVAARILGSRLPTQPQARIDVEHGQFGGSGARAAVNSPYGGSDVARGGNQGAPGPAAGAAPPGMARELTGETPLNLPGQSPGLGGAPAYGPSDAPKHGGKTLPEFVLQGMWDKLRTMPSRAGAAAWKAFEDPEHYDPKAPLEMAKTAMGRMPFAGRGQAGVGGGRLVQPADTVRYPHAHLSEEKLETLYKKHNEESPQLGSEMIAAGRGLEKPSETRTKNDPLAQRVNAGADRHAKIVEEMQRRRRFHGQLKPIRPANRYSF
jgi:hypothetical protein